MTMPKRLISRVLIIGGVVLLTLVSLVLVVPMLVPGDLIRDQIIREVELATGARVTLGEAQLQWRGGWKVTLREGTIQGTGDALAAATGSPSDLESYDLDIGEFRVAPALLPLLRKQLEIKSVLLTGPRLVVLWREGEVEAAGFTVRINGLNLGLAGLADGGVVRSEVDDTSSGIRIPDELSFAFTAAADTLVLQDVPYTRLDMRGGFADKSLEVAALSVRRSSGTLRGTFIVDFGINPWGHLEFEAEAEGVPAVALLAPWAPDIGDRLECELNATVGGSFDLQDQPTIRRTLDLSGYMTAGEGVLHAADWLRDVSSYLGKRQDLMDVRFRSLRHDFRLLEGRYLVEKLAIGGGDTDWRGAGWLDMDGAIAMDIDVKLPPGYTPDLGNWSFLAGTLRDPEGRIKLPLKLTGRSSRPTVGVDLGRMRPR